MDLTNTMNAPCVEQDPLCRRGLTGIDVRHDADVPQML
jgi:hypothetical protein